jgi:hypothetical protein
VLVGPHLAGGAAASLDLVQEERGAVVLADLLQGLMDICSKGLATFVRKF